MENYYYGTKDYLYFREGLPLGMAVEIMTFAALEKSYFEAKDKEAFALASPGRLVFRKNTRFKFCGNTIVGTSIAQTN